MQLSLSSLMRIVTAFAMLLGWLVLVANGVPAYTFFIVGGVLSLVVLITSYRFFGVNTQKLSFIVFNVLSALYLTGVSVVLTQIWHSGNANTHEHISSNSFLSALVIFLQAPLIGVAGLILIRAWTRAAHDVNLKNELDDYR